MVNRVLPVTLFMVAEMAVTPGETAVTNPAALTVATAVLVEVHVTWLVMSWVLVT
jgi:hypothetical protein